MSITASFVLNAIETQTKGEYQLDEMTSATFTFDYKKKLVWQSYEGIKDGKAVSGESNKKTLDRKDVRLKMLSMMEADVVKLTGFEIGKEISKIKLTGDAKIGGFKTEVFITHDGKKIKQVHLIAI